MGFEDNPADEDPHGECAAEIHRLQAVNAKLLAACKEALVFATGTQRGINMDAPHLIATLEAAIAKGAP